MPYAAKLPTSAILVAPTSDECRRAANALDELGCTGGFDDLRQDAAKGMAVLDLLADREAIRVVRRFVALLPWDTANAIFSARAKDRDDLRRWAERAVAEYERAQEAEPVA